MADTYDIEIILKAQLAESQKIVKAIDEITQKTKEFANQATNTGKIWSGAMLEVGARVSNLALKIPNLATSAIKAFGEQEMAIQKLSSAIRSNGGNVSEVLPIYQSFASEIQRITTYGDEQVLAMQAMASAMGVNNEQMNACIQGAIGLTQAYGMGVSEAIKAAAAVIQGKTEKLNELIPSLSKCKTEEEKLAIANKAMKDGFAQAKAEADTTLGKLKQCANAWGDLSEVVGGIFAPVVTDVATILKGMCEWISKTDERTALLTGTLTSTAVALTFAKIGGLTNVTGLIKNLAFAIMGVKGASDALNLSIKANPFGLILTVGTTAITALTSAYSYFKSKSEETYNANIKKSEEYRNALDSEMDSIKQWGLSYSANAERTKKVRREIEKYETLLEQSKTRVFGESLEELTARTDNYKAKIEKLNEVLGVLSNAQDLNKLASDRQREALKKSEEILKKNAEELEAVKTKTSELEYVRKQYKDTETQIVNLDKEFKSGNIAVSERVAKASALASARKQLVSLAQQELSLALEINNAENTSKKTSALQVQYSLEKQIAEAVSSGNVEKSKELQKELASVHAHQQKLELANTYFDSLKATAKSQDDISKLQKEANAYADSMLKKKEAEAQTEKWLNSESEKSKENQRSLDLEILRARASGNEAQAKELEGKLRIAQLTNEIFEASRKEGMSKQELINLQESASKQAQERYDLEKSITEEAQRQNLAKNAQATIEDILLKNKIEQLKAEGKITEAKELEREREIKRTLAGMGDAVSDEDKNKLADMMRQTNDYQDQQQEQRSAGGSVGGYAGDTDYTSLRSGGTQGGSSFDGTSRSSGIPATVGKKNKAFYLEWKEKGGSKSGESWTEYRDRRRLETQSSDKTNRYNFGTSYSVRGAKTSPTEDKSNIRVNARNFLSRVSSTAKDFTSTKTAQKPKSNNSDSEQTEQTKNQTPARQELTARANKTRKQNNNEAEVLNILRDIHRSVRGIEQTKV